ncbi:hypothetical protein [Thalassospira lucentensis]|uniref:hypothetical protein n=1 Tax=Thalassospira lucentensis TaxID=168935 RepID=UPI003D2D7C96
MRSVSESNGFAVMLWSIVFASWMPDRAIVSTTVIRREVKPENGCFLRMVALSDPKDMTEKIWTFFPHVPRIPQHVTKRVHHSRNFGYAVLWQDTTAKTSGCPAHAVEQRGKHAKRRFIDRFPSHSFHHRHSALYAGSGHVRSGTG